MGGGQGRATQSAPSPVLPVHGERARQRAMQQPEAGLPANHRASGESCRAKKGGRAAKKGGRQIEKKGGAKGGLGDGVASPGPSQGKQGEEKGGAKGGSGDGLATPGLAQGQVKEAPKPQRR
ncbi:twist-related protein 1-like, partial [Formica exsecta]|uniref:twist-related protein 1-like n=1 Tax=Formica exsecta TaxID=72781 RepID=UPI0011435E18